MKKTILSTAILLACSQAHAIDIPDIHPNIVEENGNLVFVKGDQKYPLQPVNTKYTIDQLVGNPVGTDKGIQFQFGDLNGRLYYGLIKHQDDPYPQPVFFKSFATIENGRANIDMSKMGGKYDFSGWEAQGHGALGYRVVTDDGTILYDGKIAFTGIGPFQVNPASVVEGPIVSLAKDGNFHNTVRISFDTLKDTTATVVAHNSGDDMKVHKFKASLPATHHEISLNGLMPDTVYSYTVKTSSCNNVYSESYTFKTAPSPGSKKSFVFAYSADSRGGMGGGERDIGTNAYIMKRVATLARFKNARFMQFTGDMINAYSTSVEQVKLEYRNWKRVIEPFAHHFPIVTAVGNHEGGVLHQFGEGKLWDYPPPIFIDRFPYETDSAEALFASQFVHPTNGPDSEDGAAYDPNPNQQDFPSYKENVFYYTYDNVAMVVLNTNYWYAPSLRVAQDSSNGGLHGYLMDKQLEWLETTLATLDADKNLDFVFVSPHTAVFPNGGHVMDDMWYYGNNERRPTVKHSPNGPNLVQQGIVEQRDKFLKILMQSKKVIAMLTADEHDFSWMRIDKNMNIYPDGWDKEDIRQTKAFRPIYQIHNGAAGAPYNAPEETLWSSHLRDFTTQYAVVFFHVKGSSLQMEVINPDTLGTILPLQPLSLSKH
ncbi:MAG: hypothetical protein DRR19_18790 [Candidatus Parabeggiatoa sp. nov. 1]|nr:MAG: hypothetical protein DRR19_18790 [Gammaproteobacteria bacterium]